MRGMDDVGRQDKLLFKEGDWQLLDATNGNYIIEPRGWQSIIEHWCINKGIPCWMRLDHDTPTKCVYCKDAMPDSIVALFKLHNMEAMR